MRTNENHIQYALEDLDSGTESNIQAVARLNSAQPHAIAHQHQQQLTKLAKHANDDRAERAKQAFQWVIYSRRPLTIYELEEAVSTSPNQRLWQSPSSTLNISRLARLCRNLINYDKTNKKVSLAHHAVKSFQLGCSSRREVASFTIKETKAEQYLADICLTYLSSRIFIKHLRGPPTQSISIQ